MYLFQLSADIGSFPAAVTAGLNGVPRGCMVCGAAVSQAPHSTQALTWRVRHRWPERERLGCVACFGPAGLGDFLAARWSERGGRCSVLTCVSRAVPSLA